MRLSSHTLTRLDCAVTRPDFDRAAQQPRILHFGIGAFHRAHQAVYTDDAMNAGDRDWGIVGVSLRSSDVAAQMDPQDGLYTVTQHSGKGSESRLIGSVKQVLVALREPEMVVDQLAAPATAIVSFTVTEKGYCRATDGTLDHMVAGSSSFYAFLAKAFAARRAGNLPGLTLVSCDNLAANGLQLQRLITAYLQVHAPELVHWFENECACPSTMVDRIVPAVTDADRDRIEAAIGVRDDAATVTEPFSQWVIEDRFVGPRPCWEVGGAKFTSDVTAYETAKLRMLNGAHSALAYLGLQRGYDYVHQAIVDPELTPLIQRLMREEAATSFTPAAGQNLDAYAADLLARFRNPALNHRLAQISMDGSQKIPQRWLETLSFHQQRGLQCEALLIAIAAWLEHVRGDQQPVDDPMAGELKACWLREGAQGIAASLFGPGRPFAKYWEATPANLRTITHKLTAQFKTGRM